MSEQEMRECMTELRKSIMWMMRDKRFVPHRKDLDNAFLTVSEWEAANCKSVPAFGDFFASYHLADSIKSYVFGEALRQGKV